MAGADNPSPPSKAKEPRRQMSMMDVVKMRQPTPASRNSNRSASIADVPATKVPNRVINKLLQRRTTTSRVHDKPQANKASYWKKLRAEENAKKLKILAVKKKIRIALRLSLVLRHWWYRHRKNIDNMILSDEKMDFLTQLIKPPAEEEKPKDILFDASAFKANKHQKMPQEARRILTILPQYRTDSEVHYVMIALRSHKQIANCPVRMQKLIARYGVLECFDDSRCVVKQGHPPQAFYYIVYGTVAVAVDEGAEKKVVCLLNKGESFGELAIVSNTLRQSSVISQTEIELVSIKKQVYEDVFMAGGTKRVTDPDHEQFIRNQPFLEGWPMELLSIHPGYFVFTYFQRGDVMVRDSTCSEWIYVIKSGSVDVLKKLEKCKPTVSEKTGRQMCWKKPEREKFDAFICGEYFKYCDANNIPVADPVTMDTADAHESRRLPTINRRRRSLSAPNNRSSFDRTLTLMQRANSNLLGNKSTPHHGKDLWVKTLKSVRSRVTLADLVKKHVKVTNEAPNNEFCPPSAELPPPTREKRTFLHDLDGGYQKRAHLLTKADLNPQFVKVQTLTKGSTFGLADIVLGEQPSLCLVSNGAECIMMKKDFYMEHCPQSLLRKLLRIVGPYPEDEELQKDLLIKMNWDAQKKAILNSAVYDIQQHLCRVSPKVHKC